MWTGRARKENSEYTLVAEQGRGAADKEVFNKIRENMMQRAIQTIQHELTSTPDKIHSKIHEFQEMAKVEREMAAKSKDLSERMRASRRPVIDGEYILRCQKCDSFAASSSDIRIIEKSHRVILDKR